MVRRKGYKKCVAVKLAEKRLKDAIKSGDYTKTEKKTLRKALTKVKSPTVARAVCRI